MNRVEPSFEPQGPSFQHETAEAAAPPEYRFGYAKGRMIRYALTVGICAAGALLASFNTAVTPSARAGLIFIAFFFGLGLLIFLRRLFSHAPALIISPKGFTLPNFAAETIAWSDVVALSRTKVNRNDMLNLTLDPETAKTLTRQNLAKFIERTTGWAGNSAGIPLSLLDADADRLVAQCAAYVELARREALAGGQAVKALPAPAALTFKKPWLTFVLLAILGLVYLAELQFAVNANKAGAPSILTLAYLGGTIHARILTNGEWWRLFTAPFLHASPLHILSNGIVLLLMGPALERIIGWRWFAAIFAASALAGSLLSVLVNPPNMVGVGASGGIMGLLAAAFIVSFRLPEGPQRTQLQLRAMQTIIPSVLPFLTVHAGQRIDYAAHTGGLIAGVLVALLIRQCWPKARGEPHFGREAAIFAGLFFAVAAASILPIMQLRHG